MILQVDTHQTTGECLPWSQVTYMTYITPITNHLLYRGDPSSTPPMFTKEPEKWHQKE